MNKLWPLPWRILQLSKGDRLKTRHRKRVWRGRNAQGTLGTSRKDEQDWVIGTEISLKASYRCSWRTKGELTRWIRESWTFQAEGTEWARLVGENLEEGCCDASRCLIQFSLAFPGEKWLFFFCRMHWRGFKGGKKARDTGYNSHHLFPSLIAWFCVDVWDTEQEWDWVLYVYHQNPWLERTLCPSQVPYVFNTWGGGRWSIVVLTESLYQRKEADLYKESLFSPGGVNCN